MFPRPVLQPRAPRDGSGALPARPAASLSAVTITLVTVLVTLANTFWLVSLRGAIGATSRIQEPFFSWIRDTMVEAPLVLAAVVMTLRLVQRKIGPLHQARPVLAGTILVALAGAGVGVVATTIDAVYDYGQQTRLIELVHHLHTTSGTAPTPSAEQLEDEQGCAYVCRASRDARDVHLRGVEDTALGILVTDLLLTGWAVALQGGRFDTPRRRGGTAPDSDPATADPIELAESTGATS